MDNIDKIINQQEEKREEQLNTLIEQFPAGREFEYLGIRFIAVAIDGGGGIDIPSVHCNYNCNGEIRGASFPINHPVITGAYKQPLTPEEAQRLMSESEKRMRSAIINLIDNISYHDPGSDPRSVDICKELARRLRSVLER